MKCTILGSGTSMGVPVAGGFYKEELLSDGRNIRNRCSAWVQENDWSILIDAGPEFRLQSISAGITHIDALLVTHEHMDHVSGIDDLRMYNYIQKNPIPVYTTKSAVASISTRFNYLFGKQKYVGSADLELHELTDSIQLGPFNITPIPARHGSLEIYGFRVNDFCYLTDVKELPGSSLEIIEGSKVVVLSALRWEPEHPTHLSIPDAVELINGLNVPEAYLVHMNGQVRHSNTNARLPKHIKLAFDYQTIYL